MTLTSVLTHTTPSQRCRYAAIIFNDPGADYDIGGTFGVAVVGFILAIFDAAVLLTFVSSAGDGLFYECLHNLTTPKR